MDRALLSYGVDVNLETANGTSLHEAALYGRKDIVKLLVEVCLEPVTEAVFTSLVLQL